MPPTDAESYMTEKSLDIDSVLLFLSDLYDSLDNNNHWPPSQLPQDKSTVPKSINATLADQPGKAADSGNAKALLVGKLLAMLKSSAGSNGGKSDPPGGNPPGNKASPETNPCHNCGKLGHWANKCPDPKKDGSSSNKSKVWNVESTPHLDTDSNDVDRNPIPNMVGG
jgi:Zinc knuckle.